MVIIYVIADADWINGHLEFGHYDLYLDSPEELEAFKKLTPEEQAQKVLDEGDLIVDGYDIDEYARPTNIQIYE